MSNSEKAHSSYIVWLLYRFRGVERILPNLKAKGKYGWVGGFLLSLVVIISALGFGIYIDGYGIHPPAQYTGLCRPPAQIKGGGCILVTVSVITVAGTVTTITQTQQAGIVNTTSRR